MVNVCEVCGKETSLPPAKGWITVVVVTKKADGSCVLCPEHKDFESTFLERFGIGRQYRLPGLNAQEVVAP
mgnify:CR=1 FL=1